MTTCDLKTLLQTCVRIDPSFRDLIDDSQCTPEQKERVIAISQHILDELRDIRRELLEIVESMESKGG